MNYLQISINAPRFATLATFLLSYLFGHVENPVPRMARQIMCVFCNFKLVCFDHAVP